MGRVVKFVEHYGKGSQVYGALYEGWLSLWSIMGRVVKFVEHYGKGG